MTEMTNLFLNNIENIVRKGESAGSNAAFLGTLKLGNVR